MHSLHVLYMHTVHAKEAIMKVEFTIGRTKQLPKGVFPELGIKILKQNQIRFVACSLVIHRADAGGLNVYCGEKEVKKKVQEILQQTWESADDWFY